MDQTNQPKVSLGIVTVLYNCDDVLSGFFYSLAQQHGVPFCLYVIDNSATDSGARICEELARRYDINCKVHFNNFNGGVARGNNQGIKLALGDGCSHVLLANNDTEFPGQTIINLFEALQREKAAAATPKIYYYGTEGKIWYGGGQFHEWRLLTPHLGMLEQDQGQCDRAGDTEYAPTCFMLVSADVFKKIGLMDEQYFCYYDDTDFVWRLRRAGLRLHYEPSCIVEHKVSTSTGGDDSPFSIYYMNRNRVYFARKNFKGLHRIFSLVYMTLTRIPRALRLGRNRAKRLWTGVRDGWHLALPNKNAEQG